VHALLTHAIPTHHHRSIRINTLRGLSAERVSGAHRLLR